MKLPGYYIRSSATGKIVALDMNFLRPSDSMPEKPEETNADFDIYKNLETKAPLTGDKASSKSPIMKPYGHNHRNKLPNQIL